MIRPTLKQARASGLPEAVGLCASNIAGVAAYINEAQEKLINDPMSPDEGWWGMWATMAFNVSVTNKAGYIVTPRNIARLILMNVCQSPIAIRNRFYEYLQFGSGSQPKACGCDTTCVASNLQAYERDTVPILGTLLSTSQQIRIYPVDPADEGREVILQGTDQNGRQIISTDTTTQKSTLGETLIITTPFTTSTNQFSTITGIEKDETDGPITFYQVDPTTGVETALSEMEPSETVAAYRRYLINGLPCSCCCDNTLGVIQVTAQAKLDFIPVQSDSDYLTIQSIPALLEECQSIRYSRFDSPNSIEFKREHHMAALSLLFGQLDHYQGKINTAISVPLFGSDRPHMQTY